MYEASQHSIITRKAAFPQSAGACKTSTQTGTDLMERKKSAGRLQETSPHNPIVLRPGSLTPVELTPPTSASTIRKPASLSNYPPLVDFSFQSLLDFSAPRPVQLLANCECEVTCMHDPPIICLFLLTKQFFSFYGRNLEFFHYLFSSSGTSLYAFSPLDFDSRGHYFPRLHK